MLKVYEYTKSQKNNIYFGYTFSKGIYMRVIKRTNVPGGFSISRKNGGIHPLKNNSTFGKGLDKEFYENTNVRHPFQSLGKVNESNTLKSIKLKSSNPKKYISFNM